MPEPEKDNEMPPQAERPRRSDFERRAREDDDDNSGKRKSPFSGLGQYIVMLVLALLVSYVMTSYIGVAKSDFTKNFQEVTASVNTAKAEVKASQDAIASAINNLPNSITTQVNNAINAVTTRLTAVEGTANNANQQTTVISGKVDTANSNISNLTNSVTSLTNKVNDDIAKLVVANSVISTLTAQLTADEVRIKALEDKATTTPTPTPTSTAPFTYTTLITNDGDATATDNTTTFSMKLTLENPTTSDLEDISIVIPVDISSPKNIIGRSMSVSNWSFQEFGTDYIILKGRNIKLNASEKRRIYFDVTLYFSGSISSGSWSVDINDKDIDILSWDYK